MGTPRHDFSRESPKFSDSSSVSIVEIPPSVDCDILAELSQIRAPSRLVNTDALAPRQCAEDCRIL